MLQAMYTCSWYSLMGVASFSRIMQPATKQKWFKKFLRVHNNKCEILASKFPKSQSSVASMGDVLDKPQSPIHGGEPLFWKQLQFTTYTVIFCAKVHVEDAHFKPQEASFRQNDDLLQWKYVTSWGWNHEALGSVQFCSKSHSYWLCLPPPHCPATSYSKASPFIHQTFSSNTDCIQFSLFLV